MARIALVTVVLIGIAAGASAKDVKIGEVSIDLVMPAGFCEPDIHSRIEEALRRVKVNETTFVGVLAEDSTACYTALLQKLKTETGAEKAQTAVNAITVVKGKVVYFYLFSLYTGRDSIDAALAKQKVNLGAFIAANKN
jgi:hypothetical protein